MTLAGLKKRRILNYGAGLARLTEASR